MLSSAVRAWVLGRNALHPWESSREPRVGHISSGCQAVAGLQAPRLPGTCGHLPPHPPSPILSLWGPIFPYMVKAVPRGGVVRTKVALLQPACHNSLRSPGGSCLPQPGKVTLRGHMGTIGGGGGQDGVPCFSVAIWGLLEHLGVAEGRGVALCRVWEE